MGGRSWIWLAVLLALALAVRLGTLQRLPLPSLSPDAEHYAAMAQRLADKHEYAYGDGGPDAYVTPGYPLFLAGLFAIDGGAQRAEALVRVLQAVLGALTIWPFFLLARRYGGELAAVCAGALLALYPSWVRAPAHLLTEVLFTFLFGWYLWAQMYALDHWQNRRWPLLAGVLLAAATLVRPFVAPLLVLPWLYVWWQRRERGVLQGVLWAAVGFVVVAAPWWIRNLVTLHRLIFFATQTGNPVLGGMDPYGRFSEALWEGVGDDTGQQLHKAGQIMVWLLQHYPWLTLRWFTVGKLSRIFASPWLGEDLPALRVVHELVVMLGGLGALTLLWRRHAWQLLTGILCCLTLLQLAFIPEPRYAYPLVGLLALTASGALGRIFTGGGSNAGTLPGDRPSL